MTAIKYFTFFTMNHQAWVTRRADRGVAEGQSSASVTSVAVPALERIAA
jgi:hypothetical protein